MFLWFWFSHVEHIYFLRRQNGQNLFCVVILNKKFNHVSYLGHNVRDVKNIFLL
jgi:hypothetical protein